MINKSILIAVLARDCNQSIIRNIPKIERLRKEFKESHVVIIENDSKDGTKETLKRWEKESIGVEAIMNDYGIVTIPEQSKDIKNPGTSMYRISKMARYRNMYMDFARNADFNIDYLIVIDIDINDFSVEGIVDSINNAPNNWGGLFANGTIDFYGLKPYYYDTYAYVDINDKQIFNVSASKLYKMSRSINRILKKKEYIKCISAFSGIGIYKWEVIKDLKYSSEKNTNEDSCFEAICEHIPFNKKITEQGYGNYICRDMKVKYNEGRDIKHFIIYSILPENVFKLLYSIFKRKRFH